MGSIISLLASLVSLYSFIIFVRVMLTWIPGLDPYNPIVQFLHQITDPVMEPARRIIPPIGMIDISPIVVMVVMSILAQILQDLAVQIR
jgi:YggT family protein